MFERRSRPGISLAVPYALNPGDLPFEIIPGQFIQLTQVRFTFQGGKETSIFTPDEGYRLAVGMALKPAGRLAFANGMNIAHDVWTVSNDLMLPRTEEPFEYDFDLRDQTLGFFVPQPKMGIPGALAPTNRLFFNWGKADAWVWLIDVTKAEQKGGNLNSMATYANEAFMAMPVDIDVGVVDITPAPGSRVLRVT